MYISTACIRHDTIKETVELMASHGFRHIELSGGTRYCPDYERDLLDLKEEYGLHYLLHNYFPPPQEDLILNLATMRDGDYQKTLTQYEASIALSRRLGGTKFALHAGFYLDFDVSQIGKSITGSHLSDHNQAMERFCRGFQQLQAKAQGVTLYIENNVLSSTNLKNFPSQEPFMMCDYSGYLELKAHIDFNMLLDVAHLYVTANSLGLNFEEQLEKMLPSCDYVHLSDNDGLHDQSRCFVRNSPILKALKKYDLRGKTLTLETYGTIEEIKASQEIVMDTLRIGV